MTETRTALFLLEADSTVGVGHALRCLALADSLAENGWRCVFAVNAGFRQSVPMPLFSSHDVVEAKSSVFWTGETLKGAWPEGVELAVVDHYDLAADFEEELADWAGQRLAVDDLLNRPHRSEAILCAAPPENATPENMADAKPLFGPSYALLRSDFVRERTHKLLSPPPGRERLEVLVNLGGSDQEALLRFCLHALGYSGQPMNVTVVGKLDETGAGDASGGFSQMSVRALASTIEMAKLMAKADLVIGACGHSSWERAAVAAPAVALIVASNQAHVADLLQSAEAALVIRAHDRLTARDFAELVSPLLESADARAEMARNAAALCDGYGARRTALALDPEQDRNGRSITLRTARREDGPVLLQWQCHPDTRRYADNPRAPDPKEHEQWLDRQLRCGKTLLEMVLCKEEPVASLRLDLQLIDGQPSRIVSIYTAPDAKRRGIASATLRAARRLVPEQPFYAKTHPKNRASRALFAKAGYGQLDDDWFVSHPMMVDDPNPAKQPAEQRP